MRIPSFLVAFGLVAIGIPTPSLSASYVGTFSGAAENPSNASPGTGTVTVLIVGDEIAMSGSFSGLLPLTSGGLENATTLAHVHCCAALPTQNAGIATIVPTLPGFPIGVLSGSFNSGPFNLNMASSYNPAFITASGGTVADARLRLVNGLNSGQAYFNIHTRAFPGGELRANLVQVPEPATWAMMITGFGLLGAALRRRRAQPAFAS